MWNGLSSGIDSFSSSSSPSLPVEGGNESGVDDGCTPVDKGASEHTSVEVTLYTTQLETTVSHWWNQLTQFPISFQTYLLGMCHHPNAGQ